MRLHFDLTTRNLQTPHTGMTNFAGNYSLPSGKYDFRNTKVTVDNAIIQAQSPDGTISQYAHSSTDYPLDTYFWIKRSCPQARSYATTTMMETSASSKAAIPQKRSYTHPSQSTATTLKQMTTNKFYTHFSKIL